ncbi:hypothetical protein [Streptosporangium sp. NPDC051022]|uniref:hypothetical protein n=1 Tax=Streptosporangium sp. NPDC051022 TaxID=3155752 RepID=UPI003424F89B
MTHDPVEPVLVIGSDEPIELVGKELYTVAFVRDYVEFHFNEAKLTALTDPRIQKDSQAWVFPQSGSRDALCALIDKTVQAVSLRGDEHILLDFGDATLTIPLDEGSRLPGPEAAHFFLLSEDGTARIKEMRVW